MSDEFLIRRSRRKVACFALLIKLVSLPFSDDMESERRCSLSCIEARDSEEGQLT